MQILHRINQSDKTHINICTTFLASLKAPGVKILAIWPISLTGCGKSIDQHLEELGPVDIVGYSWNGISAENTATNIDLLSIGQIIQIQIGSNRNIVTAIRDHLRRKRTSRQ